MAKLKKLPSIYHPYTRSGQLNFYGMINNYLSNRFIEREENTINQYLERLSKLNEIIDVNKSADDYSDEDIDRIYKMLLENGYSEVSIKTDFDVLIKSPYKLYKEIKENEDSFANKLKTSLKNERFNTIPKSFTPEVELKIEVELMNVKNAKGQKFGLLLMFKIGGRESEICGIIFDNIFWLEDYDKPFIHVGASSSKLNKRESKKGTKSINGQRDVPISEKLYELLMERKRYLESLNKDEDIGKFPVCCLDYDYKQKCKSRDLADYGVKFLEKYCGIDKSQIENINNELALNKQVDDEFFEEDPTTYIFRRNFATRLKSMNLSLPERQYLMGHEILDEYNDRRSFRGKKLNSLYKKMFESSYEDYIKSLMCSS